MVFSVIYLVFGIAGTVLQSHATYAAATLSSATVTAGTLGAKTNTTVASHSCSAGSVAFRLVFLYCCKNGIGIRLGNGTVCYSVRKNVTFYF